jgi:hypothetical protein
MGQQTLLGTPANQATAPAAAPKVAQAGMN